MTRQEAVERLNVSLTETIQAWWDETGSDLCDGQMGWVGEDFARLMARAAIAALELSADAQDYMEREGHLREEASTERT